MMKRLEAGLIDIIAAITPWLAPLIPSYLVYHNMAERLGYTPMFALIGASAVEFLGLSAVHTAVTFWQWNGNHKAIPAPMWAAVGAGAFYVIIILTVNAALDIWKDSEGVKIIAHALLSLLSVDAAVIIAVRASHARRVTDDADERKRRKEERKPKAQPQTEGAKPKEIPAMLRRKPQGAKAQFIADMIGRNGEGPLTTPQIMAQYNVSERTAQYWLGAYRALHDEKVMESAN